MPIPNPNQPFIDWAAEALEGYDRAASAYTGDKHCGLTDEGQLQMLMASLHHLADARGWDWALAIAVADSTYLGERMHAQKVAEDAEEDREITRSSEIALQAWATQSFIEHDCILAWANAAREAGL